MSRIAPFIACLLAPASSLVGATVFDTPEPASPFAADADTTGMTLAAAELTYQPQPKPAAAPAPTASPTTQETKLDQSPANLKFGDAGSKWIYIGAGVADNGENMDENVYARYGYFIAKDVELMGEAGAWQYSQEGKDATGFNLSMIIRWHFIHRERWTMFADLGIGVLAATEPVPRRDGIEGTQFNFTPRAGGGVTYQLTDDGVRLELGLRWAHVSNGRISGNNDNPGRDSAMIYAGIIFPF